MVKNALGLIETVGLVAAVEAADAAIKAANIELVGYELTRGSGLVVIKLFGDVGAVKAAVEAGKNAASKIGKVWTTHVIPRPHAELEGILLTKDTVGLNKKKPALSAETERSAVEVSSEVPSIKNSDEIERAEMDQLTAVPTCNLCLDPACSRKKGEPRINCIHYDQNNKGEL
ncbi:microcompartment protein CcmL/EutN [Sporomusaceae bacterium BoRhaA]|uniref:BMC domain-containing protein n=1 Tax=Pelorhabdus rhamnosifermentans TaxID=2772457 RepID=UPI001C061586|nr:BMC domain-containing protein [Pelorhabdus rhamnosifermentans]MBU2701841.1 microcompartment protein CcmL/EutN [Pelorhabdus rhamnosifermentans]